MGDLSFPGLEGSPGGHGNPLQYSCLENPHGQRSLEGSSPWGHKELDTTERLSTHRSYLVSGGIILRLAVSLFYWNHILYFVGVVSHSYISDSWDPMNCSTQGSSVHGIFFKARIQQWVAISSFKGSSWPRDWTQVSSVSCIAGGFLTTKPPEKLLYFILWLLISSCLFLCIFGCILQPVLYFLSLIFHLNLFQIFIKLYFQFIFN